MWKENHLACREVVIETIIISLQRIAVPMTGHDLKRYERDKAIQIENLFQPLHPLERIGFLSRREKRLQIRIIFHVIARSALQWLVDFAQKSAVVKVTSRVHKIFAQKFLIKTLLEHIEPQIAAIEKDPRMSSPRGRHACRAEQLPTNYFSHVARILHRVVQMELVHPMKFLVLVELVEVERQCRPLQIVDATKTPRSAFQMDGDIVEGLVSFPNRGADIIAGI